MLNHCRHRLLQGRPEDQGRQDRPGRDLQEDGEPRGPVRWVRQGQGGPEDGAGGSTRSLADGKNEIGRLRRNFECARNHQPRSIVGAACAEVLVNPVLAHVIKKGLRWFLHTLCRPFPPSGPPRGTYLSRRKLMQPSPPFPATASI